MSNVPGVMGAYARHLRHTIPKSADHADCVMRLADPPACGSAARPSRNCGGLAAPLRGEVFLNYATLQ